MDEENPLNKALEPLELTGEEARELQDIIEHPRAFPTVPIRGIPRPDHEVRRIGRQRRRPASLEDYE